MEQIIDIAKQDLDTYKAELGAVGILNNLTEDDYRKALRNLEKLTNELKEFMGE